MRILLEAQKNSWGFQILNVVEFVYTEWFAPKEKEGWSNVEKIRALDSRMAWTGKYIRSRASEQNKLLKSHHKLMGKALKDHHKKIGDALTDHHGNIGESLEAINENIIKGATLTQVADVSNDVAAVHNDAKVLALEVDVATNTESLKQVFVTTTLQGSYVFAQLRIGAMNMATGEVVDVTSDSITETELSTGKMLVDITNLPAEIAGATVFIFETSHTDYDLGGEKYLRKKLVSFGVPSACSA